MLMRSRAGRGVCGFSAEGVSDADAHAETRATADPSLRLKGGFGQDENYIINN
jgi:hypothetical protein